jgi:anaerobic ribonucleoside-triphosphate reductase activating protein
VNYHKIEKLSVANGTGIRVVLWVSGCTCYCKGCQNPQTWSFQGGKPFDKSAKQELFEALDKPYIQGLTFSGGHPLEPENFETVINLAKEIKEKFPTKDIWLYTGYLYEELYYKQISRILLYIDVLIDGEFIEEQKDLTLKWRGSKNQRVINVKETLKQGKIILYCD